MPIECASCGFGELEEYGYNDVFYYFMCKSCFAQHRIRREGVEDYDEEDFSDMM